MSGLGSSTGKPIETGSNRSFGLLVGGILVGIGGVRAALAASVDWIDIALWTIGAPLVLAALAAPRILTPLNRGWMLLALALSKIITPVVMGIVFIATVVPIGLIARLMGKDLLKLRLEPEAKSYWIERDPPGPAPETMKDQF